MFINIIFFLFINKDTTMGKEFLLEDLKRMKKLAGLIKESENYESDFSEYSDDALADMIINLSRYENQEEEIKSVKDEIAKRKKIK